MNVQGFAPKDLKIIPTTPLLSPFIIQSKTFENILAQTLNSPEAKLGTAMGFYPVTHRYNHIKIVEIRYPGHLA